MKSGSSNESCFIRKESTQPIRQLAYKALWGIHAGRNNLAYPSTVHYHLLKIRQEDSNGVTHAKAHVTKLRPNYSSGFPQTDS